MKRTKKVDKQRVKVSMRVRLAVSFAIPILCIIFMGIMSYQRVAVAMANNYKKSIQSSIDLSTQYLESQLNGIEGLALQYAIDTNLNNYYLDIGYDNVSREKFYQTKVSEIVAKAKLEKFIKEIYIVPEKGGKIIGSVGKTTDGFLDDILADESLTLKASGRWVTEHRLIDEKIVLNSDKYYFSYLKK